MSSRLTNRLKVSSISLTAVSIKIYFILIYNVHSYMAHNIAKIKLEQKYKLIKNGVWSSKFCMFSKKS